VGAPGSVFNFSVTLNPQFVPLNDSPPLWVELFVSTCPGATGSTSPYCIAGYPFHAFNQTFANLTGPTLVSFNVVLNGTNLWWWQMATAFQTPLGSSNLSWDFLDVANGYNSVQGPITGDFTSTLGLVLVPIYLSMFLYSGSVFFFALLIYVFLKNREARRKRVAGAMPPGAPSSPGSSTSSPPTPGDAPAGTSGAAPTGPERRCPNCQAVVYPNETACWKCGASLAGGGAPLPTGT